ncbi:hypothetical protein Lupro_03690 [Lutibacter profundi]|uniref:tRNA (Guanine-N1)-methyltransferase n=1 Tax=Lutibacter profundi TaxID=1622118 RepID=A0A109RP43_9FLAO|nr:hypothetical protein [Lutibacter profundi]AMC10406.1 hypothetical protein Lupro_03690 [Lutibacter profundi]
MKTKILILIVVVFSSTALFSQTTKKFIDTGSVKNQFDYLINKSYKYKDYKSVKISWLHKLKANVADSISTLKKEIRSTNATINSQNKKIDSLKLAINSSKETVDNLNTKIDSISIIGIQFNKGTFKTIVFSFIGILVILLLFFITRFKQSNTITKQTKQTLKELDEEFETHRKIALEREQKVRRQLQDELNKQKKE